MRYLPILLLAGCATPTQTTDNTTAFISVRWTESADAECRSLGVKTREKVAACATNGPRCDVIAPKPRDFDDYDRLMFLGHEFLHCLGWTHEPTK